MPSHATHLIFALRTVGCSTPSQLPLVNRGAQGPDMFYHNRRTKPSGVYISGALHRRGFASICGELLARSIRIEDDTLRSDAILYSLSFLSHGVADRFIHPIINYRTAWEGLEGAGNGLYRYQHALAERFCDIWAALTWNCTWTIGPDFAESYGPKPPDRDDRSESEHAEIPESERVALPPYPDPGFAVYSGALAAVYPKCRNDELLATRFAHAWQDSRGYYAWTSNLSDEDYRRDIALAVSAWKRIRMNRERDGDDWSLRFAALTHPRFWRKTKTPDTAYGGAVTINNIGKSPVRGESSDYAQFVEDLFYVGETWSDPCAASLARNEGLAGLWVDAEQRMASILERLETAGLSRNKAAFLGGAKTIPDKKGDAAPILAPAYSWMEGKYPTSNEISSVLADLLDDGDLRSFERSNEGCMVEACRPIDWFQAWFEIEKLL